MRYYGPTETQEKEQMTQARQKELLKRCNMYINKLVKGDIKDFFIVKRPKSEKDHNFPLTFTLPFEEGTKTNDDLEGLKKEKEMKVLAHRLQTLLIPSNTAKEQRVDHYLQLQTISDRLWSNVHFSNFV